MATDLVKESIRDLKGLLMSPKVRKGIEDVIPSCLAPQRMLRIAASAIEKTPHLSECDVRSVLGALMTAAALGLEPNTPAGHCYLIPYKTRKKQANQWVDVYECQFQIGYKGYVELAYRNPNCVSYVGLPVYTGDIFRHYVDAGLGELTIAYEAARAARGELEGAFSLAVYQRDNGARGRASLWMPRDEMEKIRARSQTYTSLVRRLETAQQGGNTREIERARKTLDETPWLAWEAAMFSKSAIRNLAKQLPIFGNMLAAAQLDDAAESGRLDLGAMASPDAARGMIEAGEIPEFQSDLDEHNQGEEAGPGPAASKLDSFADEQDNQGEIIEAEPESKPGPRQKSRKPAPPAVDDTAAENALFDDAA